MSNTRPFTEAHAIASVDVALLFESELDLIRREKLIAALKSHLDGFQFRETPKDDSDRAGIFDKRGPDDDLSVTIHLHEEYVHVVWMDYRGWEVTRDETIAYLKPLLTLAKQGLIELSGVGLAYRDVFFNDDPATYNAAEVFRSGGRFLAPFAFSAGSVWRTWTSWTDTLSKGPASSVKASVGIEARLMDLTADDDGTLTHVTEILHRQQIVGNETSNPAVEWSERLLSEKLDLGHKRNKSMIADLLIPEMSERIGMKEPLI